MLYTRCDFCVLFEQDGYEGGDMKAFDHGGISLVILDEEAKRDKTTPIRNGPAKRPLISHQPARRGQGPGVSLPCPPKSRSGAASVAPSNNRNATSALNRRSRRWPPSPPAGSGSKTTSSPPSSASANTPARSEKIQTQDTIEHPFRSNRNRCSKLCLPHFPHANRYPLRLKMLRIAIRSG